MARRTFAAGILDSLLASLRGRCGTGMRPALFVAAALLLAGPFAAPSGAQQQAAGDNPCDSRLIPQKGDPLGYVRRGERCEGLYVLEVAGSADLSLVAFTAATSAFTLEADDRLHVRWPQVPGNLTTRLRAVSLRRRVYYRMDTVRPAGTDTYEWPATVVTKLNLGSNDVGILGWVRKTVGEKEIDVYVPLGVGTSPDVPVKGTYVLQVVASAELAEVYVTLAELGPDGREGKYLKRDEKLDYGFYPADRPIKVALTGLPAAGLYRLTLGAVLKTGGSANRSIVFYHPGP